jgi:hypothetical protein
MNQQERQELTERLERCDEIMMTGFTESGRKLSPEDAAYIWSLIRYALHLLEVKS